MGLIYLKFLKPTGARIDDDLGRRGMSGLHEKSGPLYSELELTGSVLSVFTLNRSWSMGGSSSLPVWARWASAESKELVAWCSLFGFFVHFFMAQGISTNSYLSMCRTS